MDYTQSKAVLAIKRRPKNQNARVRPTTYTCSRCPHFRTADLVTAWVHSEQHGPWEEEGSKAHVTMMTRPKNGDPDLLPSRYTGSRSRQN